MSIALRSLYSDRINFIEPHGGCYFWVELPKHVDADQILSAAVDNGVNFFPGRYFSADGRFNNFIRLSISSTKEEIYPSGGRTVVQDDQVGRLAGNSALRWILAAGNEIEHFFRSRLQRLKSGDTIA